MWAIKKCPNCRGTVEVDTTVPLHMVQCQICLEYFKLDDLQDHQHPDYRPANESFSTSCLDSSNFIG